MLSIIIYRQLSSLLSQVHILLARVEADAPLDEVALRVAAIAQVLDDLQENVSAGPTGAFNSLARHLHWLQRYHREQKPERYAPDIADIRERDLPGVIVAVEAWGRHILDQAWLRRSRPPGRHSTSGAPSVTPSSTLRTSFVRSATSIPPPDYRGIAS